MRTSSTPLLLLILFYTPFAYSATIGEVVFGSVVFSRTGERKPVLNSSFAPTTLTNIGAWQSQFSGLALRERYLSLLYGWNSAVLDSMQVYALASDSADYNAQSAQAFMSGLYPPLSVTTQTGSEVDPDNLLWNGSYAQGPGNSTQFVRIHTAGGYDLESLYLDASTWCPAWSDWYYQYINTVANSQAESDTQSLYTAIANQVDLSGIDEGEFALWDAYGIYDYLSYEYNYNFSVHEALSSSPLADADALNQVRYLADGFVHGLYANSSAPDPVATIAGRGLATAVLDILGQNLNSHGETLKINVLFADYAPLISFFGLSSLYQNSGDLAGLPTFGSYAVFELYAPGGTNMTEATSNLTGEAIYYPDPADLLVRFLFSNGTEGGLNEYRMFGSSGPMTWNDFADTMGSVALASVADWCTNCNAWTTAPFCLAYNATAWADLNGAGRSGSVSAPVAGVIGALVTLVAMGAVMLLVYFIGGVGLARKRTPLWARSSGSDTGFRRDKMASDADLTTNKGGFGVAAEEKERVGSWELKPNTRPPPSNETHGIETTQHPVSNGASIDRPVSPYVPTRDDQGGMPFGHERPSSAVSSVRSSFDRHSIHHNPFQDPVKVHEGI